MMQRQLAAQRGDEARVAEINEQLKPLNVELRAFSNQLFQSARLNPQTGGAARATPRAGRGRGSS